MLTAVRLFDGDLRDVGGSGQDEIGMINSVLLPVCHVNNEGFKRTGV